MTDAPNSGYGALEVKLARSLTEAIVPVEAPFFDDLLAIAQKPPSKSKDHTLGFGVSAGDLAAITLLLIELAKPILRFIWDNSKDATGALIRDASENAKTVIEHKMGTWLEQKLKKPAPIVLSSDKLEELIATVERDATALKLDKDALSRLSDVLRSAFTQQ